MKPKITLLLLAILFAFSQTAFSQLKMRKAQNCNALYNTGGPFTWTGPIKNGYCHGYGTIKWYNAKGVCESKMVGTVLKGMNEGFCTFFDAKGNKFFECVYKNDKKNGVGKIYNEDGTIEEREWENDIPVVDSQLVDTVAVSESENALSDKDIETLEEMLESFCESYYKSCFSGRDYVEYSLTVGTAEIIESGVYKAEGIHSYKGTFGLSYSDMPFYAIIDSNKRTIEFNKMAKADYFHSTDYWEKCTKSF